MVSRRVVKRVLISIMLVLFCIATNTEAQVKFGVVADVHYADVNTSGTRFYRNSLGKMTEFVNQANLHDVDFVIELGDFIDKGREVINDDTALKFLSAIEDIYSGFNGPRYHVIGNHCVESLSKKQFTDNIENTGIVPGKTYYSFDSHGYHFIVLDANYKSDGTDYDHGNYNYHDANISTDQITWLEDDLEKTELLSIVFIHQPLSDKAVKNAAVVRRILSGSGNVLAVFQGHRHTNKQVLIDGVRYYNIKGMVDGLSNAYAIVDVVGSSINIIAYD